MFERICIPPKYPEQVYFDLGLLAESLIFYQEVIILVKSSSWKGLLEQCNPETLMRLLERGRLKIKYINNQFGAISQYENTSRAQYDIGLISSEKQTLSNATQKIFEDITNKKGKSRRLANRLIQYIEEISYDKDITSQLREELFEGKYITDYIAKSLARACPEINPNVLEGIVFKFGNLIGKGYSIETNLDFNFIDKFTKDCELKKPSTILAHYGSTIADLSIWSRYNTEIATNSQQEVILQSRFNLICEKFNKSKKTIGSFQDMVFDNSRAVREAVNSGMRNLNDLEPILDKSEKFSDWLRNKTPDTNLIKEYFREVTTDSWIDKLPSKMLRWALFTGVGLGVDLLGAGGVGTMTGIGVSAFDAFLIENILKGWKPNQFIDGTLDKFVK